MPVVCSLFRSPGIVGKKQVFKGKGQTLAGRQHPELFRLGGWFLVLILRV